jgi:cation diffusion facilitator family transporter
VNVAAPRQGHAHDDDRQAHNPHSHAPHPGGRHPGVPHSHVPHSRMPHSHDAADSVDAALESSAQGIRAVKISLVALGVTALAQGLVVVLSGSVALLADTIHNLSDALTALPLWIAFVVGRRAPTRRYTYGFGRAEDLAGLFVVAMIALSAVLAGFEAIRRLMDPAPVHQLGWVAVAGLLGFLGNELVAVYRIRVGRRIGSAALEADGLHARADGLTSLAVVAGAGGVALGWPLADPIVGLVISIAILAVLRAAARDIYQRLMDAVDPALVETAEDILQTIPAVVGVRQVRMRWIGHRIHADVDLDIDDETSLAGAHELAHDAEEQLVQAIPKLTAAIVHAYPRSHPTSPGTGTSRE